MDDEIARAARRTLAFHEDRTVPGRPMFAGSSREGSPGGNDGGRSAPVYAPAPAAAGRSGGVGTGPGAQPPESSATATAGPPSRRTGADPRPAPTGARDSRSVARWKRTIAAIGRICGGSR